MIQPGGAMALFVLRLASLLTLENSLGDNSTTTVYPPEETLQPNGSKNSSSSFTQSYGSSLFNLSQNLNDSLEEDFETANFSFLKSSTVGGTLLLNTKNNSGSEQESEGHQLLNLVNTYKHNSLNKEPDLNVSMSSEEETATLPPRSSETGFSPVFTLHPNTSVIPFFALPDKPTVKTLLMTYDEQKPGLKNQSAYHELEAPSADFITSEFEYYEFDGMGNNTTSDYSQELTSRSLVSPIPQPGHENSFLDYLEKEAKLSKESEISSTPSTTSSYKGAKRKLGPRDPVKHDQNIKLESSKVSNAESSKKRGIGPMIPSDKSTKITRNNPYPYGPKVLPQHVVITRRPSLTSKVSKNVFGSIFPDKDLLYDYEVEDNGNEAVVDTEEGGILPVEEKYFVQTDKPTVLFHFDKPGYAPRLPDASLPPTRPPTPSDPWDCAPKCPKYDLLDWNQDYDIRQYPETTWISTVIIADNRILAELEGYMRVQDYFYGLNDRGQLINMTVPFVTQIQHGRHPGVLKEFTDFTVSLYINHIDDPLNTELPTPISNEVLIDSLESKTIFVAGFEANVWDVTETYLEEKASFLMEKLRQNGEAFLDRYYYLASYSRPELYQPVYYELWIYATSFRDNTISVPPIAPRRRPPPNKITTKSMSKLCRGVECPSFEVLRTYRYGIQKRRYYDGLFVTTSPGVCEFTTLSVWKGFMPLHLYKHGINSHLEVIEATRPIGLIHIKEDSTSTTECPQNMTMAIYLPKRLHSNPPLTGYDAPAVTISALQDVVVYAYTVGGYLLQPGRVRKELADLKHRLTEFGACFKDDEYYVVVYDFIVRYHGRQNEIWVVAENCKATLNG